MTCEECNGSGEEMVEWHGVDVVLACATCAGTGLMLPEMPEEEDFDAEAE